MALTSVQRQKKLTERYKQAGLKRLMIWVHPDDAKAIREYTLKRAKTRAVMRELKGL